MLVFLFCVLFQAGSAGRLFADDLASFKDQKSQDGYILNLKDLINKSRKKIEKVDSEIKAQSRKRRNQQREEKAREYYAKAMHLSEEDNFEKARVFFEKAVEITGHPEMKNYVRDSVRRTKKREKALAKQDKERMKRLEIERGYSAAEVEDTYQVAISLFKRKKYLAAQDEFERVDAMFPDHKATRSYLMIIDQEIAKEQKKRIEEKLRTEAIARRKEKEQWKKELELKEKQRFNQLNEQADTLYKEALQFYGKREFGKAKEKFKEVEWILPNYKATVKYLSRIDKDVSTQERKKYDLQQENFKKELERERELKQKEESLKLQVREEQEKEWIERLKEEAEFVYVSAVFLYDRKQFVKSKDKFVEVDALYPDYKDTSRYLSKIDKKIKDQKISAKREDDDAVLRGVKEEMRRKKEEERQEAQLDKKKSQLEIARKKKKAAVVYQAGIALYKENLLIEAQDKFNELADILPDYKKSRKYLSKINKRLTTEQKLLQEEKNRQVIARLKREKLILKNQETVIEQEMTKQNQDVLDSLHQISESYYSSGVLFYDNKLYVQAKEKFLEVDPSYSKYKSARKYIRKISELTGQPYEDLPDFVPNVKTVDKPLIVKRDPSAEEEMEVLAQRSDSVSVELLARKKKFLTEAQRKYEDALKFYKRRNYGESKIKFIEVEALLPNFRDVREHLAKIDADIQKGGQKYYSPKKTRKKRGKKSGKNKSKKEEKILDDSIVTRIEESAGTIEKVSDKHVRKQTAQVYQRAVILYRGEELNKAQTAFLEVDNLIEGYRNTNGYLKRIERRLGRKAKRSRKIASKMGGLSNAKKQKKLEKKTKFDLAREKRIDQKMARLDKRKNKKIKKEYEKGLKEVHGALKESESLAESRRKEFDRRTRDARKKMKRVTKERELLEKERTERFRLMAEQDEMKLSALRKDQQSVSSDRKSQHQQQVRQDEKDIQLLKDKQDRKESELKEREGREKREMRKINELKAKEERYRREIEEIVKKIEEEYRQKIEKVEGQIENEERRLADEKNTVVLEKEAFEKRKSSDQKKVIQLKKLRKDLGFEEFSEDAYEYKVYQTDLMKKHAKELLDENDKKVKKEEEKKRLEFKKNQKEIDRKIAGVKKGQKNKRKSAVVRIYEEAMDLYKRGEYGLAKAKFGIVEGLRPGYKSAEKYIRRSEKQGLKQEKEKKAVRSQEKKETLIATTDKEEAYRTKVKESLNYDKKEVKKVEKQQKKDLLRKDKKEEQKKKLVTKERQKDVQRVYAQAVRLYKQNKIALSKEKFRKFENLLVKGEFSEAYLAKMRRRLAQDKERINQQVENERKKKENIKQKREERLAKEKQIKELKRQKELAQLDLKVKKEEQRLEAEKRRQEEKELKIELKRKKQSYREEARLARLKRLEEVRTAKIELRKKKELSGKEGKTKQVKRKQGKTSRGKRLVKSSSEKRKRSELEGLVKNRRKEIAKERIKIQKEFEDSLSQLYSKATILYKAGSHSKASRIFKEIEQMSPDFKKTKQFLSKIKKSMIQKNQQPLLPFAPKPQEIQTRQDLINNALNALE